MFKLLVYILKQRNIKKAAEFRAVDRRRMSDKTTN